MQLVTCSAEQRICAPQCDTSTHAAPLAARSIRASAKPTASAVAHMTPDTPKIRATLSLRVALSCMIISKATASTMFASVQSTSLSSYAIVNSYETHMEVLL
eukprot:IDg20063t1